MKVMLIITKIIMIIIRLNVKIIIMMKLIMKIVLIKAKMIIIIIIPNLMTIIMNEKIIKVMLIIIKIIVIIIKTIPKMKMIENYYLKSYH